MKRSIRTKLFVTICLISGLFLLLFGGIYTTYYDDYVVYRRQQQLHDAFTSLQSNYHGSVADDLAALQDAELQYSIRMLITNPDGYIKYNSLLRTQKQLTQFFGGGAVTIFQLIDQLPRAFGNDVYFNIIERDNTNNMVLFSAGESSVGVQFIGLLGTHNSGDMVLLQMPSPVIRSAGEFTGVFLLAVGGFSLAVSLLVAYFLSRRFTQPVLEIKEMAEHMADLDFSSRYCGPVEDEIGELGSSINRLSGHLEQTISALRKTNVQLEEEIDRARRLDEMRRNLLVNVSHELKTPLALVQGYAEGLRINLNSDPESREFYCSVIEEETQHMARMVGELLSVSRIEAGTTAPQPERFSLDEMLDDLLARLTSAVSNRALTVDCPPTDATLFADRDMISQVLTNYLSNAIDHTPQGGRIAVRAQREGALLRLSVFNEGSHIPEEELPRIWQSFYKLDQARTRAFGGTGIGLSIVKAVIEAHKCQYGARNLDDGVEFWCTLPLAQEMSEEDVAQADQEAPTADQDATTQNLCEADTAQGAPETSMESGGPGDYADPDSGLGGGAGPDAR